MHVLIVDEEVPYPLNTGKRLRSYNLLKRLQEQHQITYVCYGSGEEVLPDCPNVSLLILKSPILKQSGIRFYLALLKNLLSPLPYVVERHKSMLMQLTVEKILKQGGIDLVHCEWTPYSENIKMLLGDFPTVLSAHNVEAQIWQRYYETESNQLKKLYIKLKWQKMLNYEKMMSSLYSQVAVVSEPDQAVFVNHYECKKVTVVANGVDEKYFYPTPSKMKANSMVFTGSMDWRPNQDGVRYFIEEIFPIIKKRIHDATFTVVGRKPPQWLVALAERTEGVVVTGTVDDVRPYISESMLYVVPLRVGGGSRLKILEAMAMEKVVLSTSVGAEGLDVSDGKDIILKDRAQDFADAACEILKNPGQFNQYEKVGRELILVSYTWDAISKVMNDVWEQARG